MYSSTYEFIKCIEYHLCRLPDGKKYHNWFDVEFINKGRTHSMGAGRMTDCFFYYVRYTNGERLKMRTRGAASIYKWDRRMKGSIVRRKIRQAVAAAEAEAAAQLVGLSMLPRSVKLARVSQIKMEVKTE
jgi:hypothetical protein